MRWEIDMAHSHIGFSIRHMKICRVHGRFREGTGAVDFDAAAIERAKLLVQITTESLDTGIEQRDKHLRSKDLFNTEALPTMTFESSWNQALASGDLMLDSKVDLTIDAQVVKK